MKNLDKKIAVSPSTATICSACGYSEENSLSYGASFADAQERMQRGERQIRCSQCLKLQWEVKRDAPKSTCLTCR